MLANSANVWHSAFHKRVFEVFHRGCCTPLRQLQLHMCKCSIGLDDDAAYAHRHTPDCSGSNTAVLPEGSSATLGAPAAFLPSCCVHLSRRYRQQACTRPASSAAQSAQGAYTGRVPLDHSKATPCATRCRIVARSCPPSSSCTSTDVAALVRARGTLLGPPCNQRC